MQDGTDRDLTRDPRRHPTRSKRNLRGQGADQAPEGSPTLYRRRWEVETLFATLKSRSFDLEATRLTAPDRIRRLIGLLAIAFAWSHLVGEKRAETCGLPPRKGARTPKPLPLRTAPAPRHPYHTGAATNSL